MQEEVTGDGWSKQKWQKDQQSQYFYISCADTRQCNNDFSIFIDEFDKF